jgi:hypothetical protein
VKIAFYVLIGLHAIIHCFGFLKAFNAVEFNAITQPITKGAGVLWLMACLLLLVTLLLDAIGVKYWWVIGIIAVLISQVLIFSVWQDAKFGTIPNLLILLICGLSFSDHNFTQMVTSERALMLSNAKEVNNQRPIADLPIAVQSWLDKAGVHDSTRIKNVYLTQRAQLKMKPEQDSWYTAKADQYFITNPPSFNWSVRLKMNPFLPISGRDKFENGKGEMQIKLFSAIAIVDEKNNKKIDQGALQRFLAEIAWFPAAARNNYIDWEEIDERSAKATMTCNGTAGSGVFHFDEEGNFMKFSAMRYQGGADAAELKEWIVQAKEYKSINGVYIPVKLEATWKLEDKEWTWLKLEILDIKYNVNTQPLPAN